MADRLYQVIEECRPALIAFVGLAKNTGKTEALNQAAEELAARNRRLGLLSYGRDGEEIDEITRQKKPAVRVPPSTYFITVEGSIRSGEEFCREIKPLDIDTPLGQVKLYQSSPHLSGPLEVVLAGINRRSRLWKAKKMLLEFCDFVLADGALDRRSSALPGLAEGVILSTGAVLGYTPARVVEKTDEMLRIFSLPLCDKDFPGRRFQEMIDKDDKDRGESPGEIYLKGGEGLERYQLKSSTSFGLKQELQNLICEDAEFTAALRKSAESYLLLHGAFTDSLAGFLASQDILQGLTVVVRDPIHVFIDGSELKALEKNGIELKLRERINLLAITVNPHNPQGPDLSGEEIVRGLKEHWPELPTFDIKAESYQE